MSSIAAAAATARRSSRGAGVRRAARCARCAERQGRRRGATRCRRRRLPAPRAARSNRRGAARCVAAGTGRAWRRGSRRGRHRRVGRDHQGARARSQAQMKTHEVHTGAHCCGGQAHQRPGRDMRCQSTRPCNQSPSCPPYTPPAPRRWRSVPPGRAGVCRRRDRPDGPPRRAAAARRGPAGGWLRGGTIPGGARRQPLRPAPHTNHTPAYAQPAPPAPPARQVRAGVRDLRKAQSLGLALDPVGIELVTADVVKQSVG